MALIHFVEFVGHQNARNIFAEQAQHLGVCVGKTAGIDHEQHQVHITHCTEHSFIQRAVQGIGMRSLKTRCIDKNKLGVVGIVYAGDAVARGLRLARSDADFLANQGVEQGGFTDVGFAELMPMSAKNAKDIQRLLVQCEKYLPEQAWWYTADELTDRSEKFLVSEMIREKLFRLTGDELPYTSTVVIDKFTEEPGKTVSRMVRVAATIIVERDGHKAMVIGEGGERLKQIGTLARQELEKLMDAKVFLELWVKVRSGWADDEARVRSFGYE